jgi:hypothetical protein
MNPSESAIETAIENLKKSPGVFQRLAESYAQILYPERFMSLIPKGRNPDEVPIKGWPDAYASSKHGIDIVEVTHSEHWQSHIDQDIKKAQTKHVPLAGFMFVAWARTPVPELIQKYRDQIICLGVPAEKITFVFRQQLVRDLAQPRFAQLWVDPLKLPSDSYPFTLIEQMHTLLGCSGDLNTFTPTKDEYLKNLVHRPAIATDVERQLETKDWCLVRGLGASGKTVLAVQIGLGNRFARGPVYYLDLSFFSDDALCGVMSELEEAITTRADQGVLFIVDNIHLHEELARLIFDHWDNVKSGSRILLLGRWVTSGFTVYGRMSPFADMEFDAVILKVETNDLIGVFSRLLRRINPHTELLNNPPDQVLNEWLKIFGGDLIAFSAAVTRRAKDLQQGRWQLRAEDARNYVKDKYLEPLNDKELRSLTTIAVLAKLELDTPAHILETGGTRRFTETGLIHRTEHGKDAHVYWHLIHSGLGELIVAAFAPSIDESKVLANIAKLSVFTCMSIVNRFSNQGRQQEASRVLKAANESPLMFFRELLSSVIYLRANIERLDLFQIVSLPESEEYLTADRALLVASLLQTHLGYLTSFLQYARNKLPAVYDALSEALSKPENLEALSSSALKTPFHFLASFLQYAENKLPAVYDALSVVLSKPENLEAFSSSARRTPLGDLASFLQYAENKLPAVYKAISVTLSKPENLAALSSSALKTPFHFLASFLQYAENKLPVVYDVLSEALLKPENLAALSSSALRTPLSYLASFLQYAENKLPPVFEALSEVLSKPENLETLSARALRTLLGDLASFLQYAENKLPAVYKALSEALSKPKNLEALSSSALRTPLNDLASFLQYAENKLPTLYNDLTRELSTPEAIKTLADYACYSSLNNLSSFLRIFSAAETLAGAIDRQKWNKIRLDLDPGVPEYFIGFALSVNALGHRDLAEKPAMALITLADPGKWHSARVTLSTCSLVLNFGNQVDIETRSIFLNTVATPRWLRNQYISASIGGIAGSLLSLCLHQNQSVISHFITDDLKLRIKRELKAMSSYSDRMLADSIQLLGCADVLGIDTSSFHFLLPNISQLIEVLEFTDPIKGDHKFGLFYVNLWIGLRAIARLSKQDIRVPYEAGSQILSLWKKAEVPSLRHERLNKLMIEWLERCADNNWHLISETSPWRDF